MKPMDLLEALGELPEEYIVREFAYEPPRKHTAFLISKPFLAGISTAACLLLIVGSGVGIWSKQQKIEIRPPEESNPVMATETSTETTAQFTTTSQITEKQTETPVKATVPTELPVIVPQTTAAHTIQTTATQAVTTQATTVITFQTSLIETAAPTNSVTTVTTEPQYQATNLPHMERPAVVVTATQPVQITEPATVPQTETVPFTETTVTPQTSPVQIAGFRVEQYPDCQKVICTDDFPEPDGELQAYLVVSDELVLLAASEPEHAERTYEIECPEAGKVFTVTQKEYSEFVLTVDAGELIDIALNNVHGFFLLQDETCSLYWFRDGEGFFVSGDTADLKYLMAIFRSFTPSGTT